MPQLSLEQIRETRVLCPSIEEQTTIGLYFETVGNLITLHQRELDKWEELKKGLLQQMFVQESNELFNGRIMIKIDRRKTQDVEAYENGKIKERSKKKV